MGGQILSEVLPYLEVNKGNEDEIEKVEQMQTPDILGKTILEAQKILKDNGLEIIINNESEDIDKENTKVTSQIPQAGITVNKGSKVYINY